MHRKALGKGLEALFGTTDLTGEAYGEEGYGTARRIIKVSVNDIVPNREQPRERFSEEAMEELKKSIAENGILEPPIVRRMGDFFELVAGERRYRAAKELNFDTIEVIVMDVESDERMLVLSLIENIQREDLNAIEEAKAYLQIMTSMNLTQEGLAEVVGKSRSTVANTMRLLSLAEPVQDMVREGRLAPGSARSLVPVEDTSLQYKLARTIAEGNLSARQAEALVKRSLTNNPRTTRSHELSPLMEETRLQIQRILGTEVKIKGTEKKGKIEIDYYNRDDLERIMETIKGKNP